MAHRLAQSVCLLLTVIVVAGMGLSAQGFGPTAGPSGNDCCCKVDAASDTCSVEKDSDSDCCPGQPGQTDDEPCSCACSSCNAMARTISLFSTDTLTAPLFDSGAQLLAVMPQSLPASAVLGVDIQPPIA